VGPQGLQEVDEKYLALKSGECQGLLAESAFCCQGIEMEQKFARGACRRRASREKYPA
jgi:hypothetical protein